MNALFKLLFLLGLLPLPGVPAAKITLKLALEKRRDQYHEVFQPGDAVEIHQNGQTVFYLDPYILTDGMELVLKDTTRMEAFYANMGHRVFLGTIIPSDSINAPVIINMPVRYTFEGQKIICPKCGKSDQTDIAAPQAYWFEVTEAGGEIVTYISEDTTLAPHVEKHKIWMGNYICKRDKIAF
ncbi:hypothetical protein [Taibaiella chishuiensis]|uniref:Uncharacterized protein n=1 Tax=Taibaiella chishuiensis TaxID=1434707 RepID=A0A2P8D314_9BACT|nr:hypothetical protein [Taibaiella chishuiensis]PSK91603.1 hypothetical protein B0I18_105188 [Taibaiella chishuiensis]